MRVKNKGINVLGGIMVGIIMGLVGVVPQEYRNLLPLPTAIGTIFIIRYCIVNHEEIWIIISYSMFTILLGLLSIAYFEYKYYGTERMIPYVGIFSFACFIVTFIMAAFNFYKKNNIKAFIACMIMATILSWLFILVIIS